MLESIEELILNDMPTLHSLLGTCCWLSYPSWYGKECKVEEVWPLVLFYFFLQHDSCSSEPYRALQHVHNRTYPMQSLQHLQHCWSFTLIPDGPLLFCLVSCLLDVKQQTNEWMRCLHVCIMWRTLEYLMCLIMFTLNRTSFRSGKWKKKILFFIQNIVLVRVRSEHPCPCRSLTS